MSARLAPLRPLSLAVCLLLPALAAGCGGSSDGAAGEVAEARARLEADAGGRLVLRAIDAHGGLEAWYAAPTSSYRWEYANVGADLQFASFLTADNRTRRVYHELLSIGPYGAPAPADGAFAWDGTEAWIAPGTIERINPRFWATTGYYFEQIPFVLADPGLTYTVLPPDTLGDVPHERVRVGFEAGVGDAPEDTYTLYLDPETDRVAAIHYTVTYGRTPPPEGAAETRLYYEDYTTVDGLTVPTYFRGYEVTDGRRGAFKNEAWADSISFRRPFDASRLAMPDDARPGRPPGV